jgi:2-dehydropantoate 2-reductase
MVPDVAHRLRPLFGRDTAVLIAANGIPWWYFHRHGGELDGRRLESVDPGGRQWELIGPERALGAVLWQAGQIEAPGVIRHTFGDRMPLGEPDGSSSARIERLSEVLAAAGIIAPVMPDIRNEMWVKLWGNLSFNPVSVLTGGTLGQLVADPGTSAVIRAMMAEAQAVAERLGIRFPMTVEERLQAAKRAGSHKTSMLQDFEQGRSLELEALVGAVIELGRLVGIATPTIGMVYDLVAGKTRIQDVGR